jgi:hypothetical protein
VSSRTLIPTIFKAELVVYAEHGRRPIPTLGDRAYRGIGIGGKRWILAARDKYFVLLGLGDGIAFDKAVAVVRRILVAA